MNTTSAAKLVQLQKSLDLLRTKPAHPLLRPTTQSVVLWALGYVALVHWIRFVLPLLPGVSFTGTIENAAVAAIAVKAVQFLWALGSRQFAIAMVRDSIAVRRSKVLRTFTVMILVGIAIACLNVSIMLWCPHSLVVTGPCAFFLAFCGFNVLNFLLAEIEKHFFTTSDQIVFFD